MSTSHLSRATSRAQSRATNKAPRVICAITESRGVAATVGMCFLSVDTGECVLSEVADTQTYVRTIHKLSLYDPGEVVMPQPCVAVPSKLYTAVLESIPGARVTGIARRMFNEAEGMESVERLTLPQDVDGVRVLVVAKFYAVCAMAAAVQHVAMTLNVSFAPRSLRVRYESSEGSMLIDHSTVRSLELIQNATNARSHSSLLGAITGTSTPMGLRLLRATILQPLTDRAAIDSRLDALDELTQSEAVFFACQSALKPFQDVDRLVTALVAVPTKPSVKISEQRVNDVILLKQSVLCLPAVVAALDPTRSPLLRAIRELCVHQSVASDLVELVDEYINQDCHWARTPVELRNQRCYAVRTGTNGLLDVARQTYKEVTEDVAALVARIQEDVPEVETKFEMARGYYLRMPCTDAPVSGTFINQVVRRKYVECSTMELLKLNAKLRDSLTEIMLMSDNTVEELIDQIREHVPALYKVCEGLAMLDMLVALANLATASAEPYVRPVFGELLAVKNGRHAVKEVILLKHGRRYVANDVYAHPATSHFQIITGTNMSGKSTYLKQTAVLCVLAQMGSFVPAEQATFPIYGALHCRASADDSDAAETSAFALDMREAAFLLSHAALDSLVIIDEMARGSSVHDGLSVALAIAEALIATGATIMFATHFSEIADILAGKVGVSSLHMRMDEREGAMRMLYKICDGKNTSSKHYGLKLARVLPFPGPMLRRTEQIARELAERAESRQDTGVGRRRRTVLELSVSLKGVYAVEGVADDVLARWLTRLQAEFVARMTEGEA